MPPNTAKPAHDLWPYITTFTLRDADAQQDVEQRLVVVSGSVACALGVMKAEDVQGDPDALCLVFAEDGAVRSTLVLNTEDLLRHTIGLQQRLIAQVGAERAREIADSVEGYTLHTLGSA